MSQDRSKTLKQLESHLALYGSAFLLVRSDGTMKAVDPRNVIVSWDAAEMAEPTEPYGSSDLSELAELIEKAQQTKGDHRDHIYSTKAYQGSQPPVDPLTNVLAGCSPESILLPPEERKTVPFPSTSWDEVKKPLGTSERMRTIFREDEVEIREVESKIKVRVANTMRKNSEERLERTENLLELACSEIFGRPNPEAHEILREWHVERKKKRERKKAQKR